MKTGKEGKVWRPRQKCVPEAKRQNNFFHSGKNTPAAWGEKSEKRKKESGKTWRGVLAKCTWAVGPELCFPAGVWVLHGVGQRETFQGV